MEQSTLFAKIDNLERFENLGEFGGSDVGVDVEDLTMSSFGQTGENGKSTGSNGCFDRLLVDGGNSTDVSVLGFVEILGGENSSGDGSSSSSEGFESGNESEILREEDSSSVGESTSVGDTNTWSRRM